MRHLQHFVNRARHNGVHAWQTARHYGRIADRYVQHAVHIYGHAIQPGLRAAGVNTSDFDSKLLNAHDLYSQFQDNVKSGIQVGDKIAAHLRHY